MRRGKKRLKKPPKKASRQEVRQVLRLLNQLAYERGMTAENRAEEALIALSAQGLLKFERSERWSAKDRNGIDFEVWGLPPNGCHFTMDVKSSPRNAKLVRDNASWHGRRHHYPLLVRGGDSIETVSEKILKLLHLDKHK